MKYKLGEVEPFRPLTLLNIINLFEILEFFKQYLSCSWQKFELNETILLLEINDTPLNMKFKMHWFLKPLVFNLKKKKMRFQRKVFKFWSTVIKLHAKKNPQRIKKESFWRKCPSVAKYIYSMGNNSVVYLLKQHLKHLVSNS